MRREEVLNRGSKQLETSRKPNSPINWSINSTNRNVPHGHDLWTLPLRIYYGAKSQGLLTVQKPFIFYGRHDRSRQPQNPRATEGLTKSIANELNKTDEAILQDEPKQVPTSLTRASGLFNTTNNASDGYQTSCTDCWEHTKAPLLSRRRYQRRH